MFHAEHRVGQPRQGMPCLSPSLPDSWVGRKPGLSIHLQPQPSPCKGGRFAIPNELHIDANPKCSRPQLSGAPGDNDIDSGRGLGVLVVDPEIRARIPIVAEVVALHQTRCENKLGSRIQTNGIPNPGSGNHTDIVEIHAIDAGGRGRAGASGGSGHDEV